MAENGSVTGCTECSQIHRDLCPGCGEPWTASPVVGPDGSAEEVIKVFAHMILAKTIYKANPVAVLLGLGNCQVVPSNERVPIPQLTDGAAEVHFFELGPYWIVWFAFKGKPPRDLVYTRRCLVATCVSPEHGIWESEKEQEDRAGCKDVSHWFIGDKLFDRKCEHEYPCLSGEELKGVVVDKA